jgi:hypothetical protein
VAAPASLHDVACDAACATVLGSTTTKNDAPGNGVLHLSADGGATWGAAIAPSPAGQIGGVAVSADGSVLAAAVYNAGIYLSTDGGASWAMKAPPALSTFFRVHLSNDGAVLATVGAGPSAPQISLDGGATWTSVGTACSYQGSALSRDGRVWYGACNNGVVMKAALPSASAAALLQVPPLSTPTGVAVTPSGDLLVADFANSCLRQVALARGAVTTAAGACGRQGSLFRGFTGVGVARAAGDTYVTGGALYRLRNAEASATGTPSIAPSRSATPHAAAPRARAPCEKWCTSSTATSHEHIENIVHPSSTPCTFFNSIHAMFVINISFFPIEKNIIGFLNFLELLWISTFIGMVFYCEFAISFFNIFHLSILFNT